MDAQVKVDTYKKLDAARMALVNAFEKLSEAWAMLESAALLDPTIPQMEGYDPALIAINGAKLEIDAAMRRADTVTSVAYDEAMTAVNGAKVMAAGAPRNKLLDN